MENALKFLSEQLGISENDLSFVYLSISNEGSGAIKLYKTAYFQVLNHNNPVGKTLHYVSCDLNNPASIYHIYNANYFTNPNNNLISAVELAELKTELNIKTDNFFTGFLPVGFLNANKIALDNVFNRYKFVMNKDGIWGNEEYSKGDIITNKSHNIPAVHKLNKEHVSYVSIL
jgi:hypothetical protein